MMSSHSLQLVDFIDDDGSYTTGLIRVGDTRNLPDLRIDEKMALLEAESFEHIHFVFFRRFSDGRSSQILTYVVDNSCEQLDEKTLAELHLQVWLHGVAPLLYIAWPSRVDVLTCAREPDFWESDREGCRYNPVEKIDGETLKTAGTINQELQRFSALTLADGTFWENPSNRELANHHKAAHQSLIQAVVEADNDLEGGGKSSSPPFTSVNGVDQIS